MMIASTQSYFIRSRWLKRLFSDLRQIKAHAESAGNGDLLSKASKVLDRLMGADYYVGIPDESYPTMYPGRDLVLDGMDDGVTIRVEFKAGMLGEAIAQFTPAVAMLKEAGDGAEKKAEAVLAILESMKSEEYRGKTHQVASFDPLGERLGYYP